MSAVNPEKNVPSKVEEGEQGSAPSLTLAINSVQVQVLMMTDDGLIMNM